MGILSTKFASIVDTQQPTYISMQRLGQTKPDGLFLLCEVAYPVAS